VAPCRAAPALADCVLGRLFQVKDNRNVGDSEHKSTRVLGKPTRNPEVTSEALARQDAAATPERAATPTYFAVTRGRSFSRGGFADALDFSQILHALEGAIGGAVFDDPLGADFANAR
jgi:hypothetical protein